MSLHVGTHIDAPAHMIQGGKQLSDYPIEKFIGKAILVDARDHDSLDQTILAHSVIEQNSIVLFYTGWDRYFFADSERYFKQHPVFTLKLVQELIKSKIKMVGFDLPGPDRWPFELHKILLKNDTLIAENCTNLERLLDATKIELYALPLAIAADGAPARVVAKIG